MKPRWNHYVHMHFIVILWGFTGILGKLIAAESALLVWYRTIITTLILFVLGLLQKKKIVKGFQLKFLVTGFIIALHWISFYTSIKISNISVALSAFGATSFFTAIIEPIVFKRRVYYFDFIPGLFVASGLIIIFYSGIGLSWGIGLGLLAAITTSLFSSLNGKWTTQSDSLIISFYEMIGAFIGTTFYILFFEPSWPDIIISSHDLFWIFILSAFCTVYPFMASISLMKIFRPVILSLAVNLEPVYTILLALLIFRESELMNYQFYLGALIIFITVLIYPLFRLDKINQ